MELHQEEKRISHNLSQGRWRTSSKGIRYSQSIEGKEARRKYEQSPKSNATRRNWDKSYKGLLNIRFGSILGKAKLRRLPLLSIKEFYSWWESLGRSGDNILICDKCSGIVTTDTPFTNNTHLRITQQDPNLKIGYVPRNLTVTCRGCNL